MLENRSELCRRTVVAVAGIEIAERRKATWIGFHNAKNLFVRLTRRMGFDICNRHYHALGDAKPIVHRQLTRYVAHPVLSADRSHQLPYADCMHIDEFCHFQHSSYLNLTERLLMRPLKNAPVRFTYPGVAPKAV